MENAIIMPDGPFRRKYKISQTEADEVFFQSIKDQPELINSYIPVVDGRDSGYTPLLYATHLLMWKMYRLDPRCEGLAIKDMFMYKVANYLLDHGADVNMVQTKGPGAGQTSLHYFAQDASFDYDLAKRILDMGGDLTIQDKPPRCTPIHYASINNWSTDFAALKLYLQYPYDIDIANRGGWTCYDLAVTAESNQYYPEDVQKKMNAKRIAEGKYDAVGEKPNGILINQHTNKPYVDPSSGQERDWNMGHLPERGYSGLHDNYMDSIDSIPSGLSEEETQAYVDVARDYLVGNVQDALNYQVEDIHTNQSRGNDTPGNTYPDPPIFSDESNGAKAQAAVNAKEDRKRAAKAKKSKR